MAPQSARPARLASPADAPAPRALATVWKLERLGRSLPHLIETMTSLATRGVGFRSITEAIDTTTPGERLVFHLFGASGQFERDFIQERTRTGLIAGRSGLVAWAVGALLNSWLFAGRRASDGPVVAVVVVHGAADVWPP
jgi:Resolvase, N terminal domain